MTDEGQEIAEPQPRRGWGRRIAKGLAILVGVLALLVLGALWGIDTQPGHRLIADRIAALRPANGLRIKIGRIDGSIWRKATLRDVRLYDLDGRFFEAPEIGLDWHPTRWAHNLLDIDRLTAPLVVLERLPRLKSTQRGPILPSFDIRIGGLRIEQIKLGKAVAGRTQTLSLGGKADIRNRRAMIALNAGSAAGDRIVLDLDAEPDGNRFRLAGDVTGPTGGTVAGLLGTRQPVMLKVGGRGTWQTWNGTAQAMLGGKPVADLALGVREGRYLLSGTLAPSTFLQGKLQRLTAPTIRVAGEGTLADRVLDGWLRLATPALRLVAAGKVDLATSSFAGFEVTTQLLQPRALFPNMSGRDIRLKIGLDGPFKTAAYRYALASPHLAFDQTGFDLVRASGAGKLTPLPLAVPIQLHAARVTGVGTVAGGILANLNVKGVLRVDSRNLIGNDLALTSDKLKGRLALRIDLATGRYDVAVTGGLARYLIPGLGIVDVQTKVTVLPGPGGRGTVVTGTGEAVVQRFDNAFLKSLAGGNPRITTRLVRSPDGIIHFSDTVLTGPSIRITGSGLRRNDGSFQFAGAGTQASYGPFRMTLDGMIDHPTVRVQLERPVPALGLSNVALDLDPVDQGFQFRAGGGSTLGRFDARGLIQTLPNQPTLIQIAALDVSGTHATGTLRSDPNGFTGRLDVAGGGIAGTMDFRPQGTIQRIEPHLTFTRARLSMETPVTIRRGRVDGALLLDPAGLAVEGTAQGAGIRRGAIALSRLNVGANLKGGSGRVTAAISGSRGRMFDLNVAATLTPGRAIITGRGKVDNRPIRLAIPAIVTTSADGWSLAHVRVAYADGAATLSGSIGRSGTSFDAGLERMPLAVLDIFAPSAALGGYATGKLSFRQAAGAAPTGRIDMAVRGLTRSGLVLTSTPVDVGVAGVLTATGAGGRAVVVSGGKTIGRAQAKLGPLGPGQDIISRLIAAPLFAQLRYSGPGDTLWRMIGVETINLSGPLGVSADVTGTPQTPLIRGTVSSNGGRIESAVTGTVITNIRATGRFDGSRLVLDTMSGRAGGGSVTGKGSFEFGAGKGGLGMDLSVNADEAVLLNRDDIGATVTGPLRLRSDGIGGTISGDVKIDKGRFRLGRAAAAEVPRLAVKELNSRDDDDDNAPIVPWNLDIKADARNQLMVTGLGLDSEWRARLTIKGAVNNPAIGGRVDLVRGGYEFAGRRFTLDRGLIRFTGEAPPDPVLDVTAVADLQGINATIHISGTGLRPEITFASVPALPEDELLSRVLFGTSITNLSAPEALQLAAAVASLRAGSGGGMNLDPINAVRKAVRLDRLRILPADVTTGQKTSVAAGKYIGRRTYVELITDGQGYSATSVEFRITRWLSLLSTISTIGRQSANVKISKDY